MYYLNSVRDLLDNRHRQLLKSLKRQCSRALLWMTAPQKMYFIGEPLFHLLGRRSQKKQFDLKQVTRILVICQDRIGDVILTTPFLRELRRNLPQHAEITLVIQPFCLNVVELCPYVNHILCQPIAPGTLDKGGKVYIRQLITTLFWSFAHVWKGRFELAIIPRRGVDLYLSTFLAYFSGAYWRVAYSEQVLPDKKRLNSGYDRLLTHPILNTRLQHQVAYNLDAIRFLNADIQQERLEVWTSDEDENFAEQLWAAHHIRNNTLVIAIAPGASRASKMWPIMNFSELGLCLRQKYHAHIVIIGGPGEEELAERFYSPTINIVGTTLRHTEAVLKKCSLFIGNDSGPMHLAAAAGVPIVEISMHPKTGSLNHSYSPVFFHPWQVPHTVLQPEKALAPCEEGCTADEAHCISTIRVAQVRQAVEELLSRVNIMKL